MHPERADPTSEAWEILGPQQGEGGLAKSPTPPTNEAGSNGRISPYFTWIPAPESALEIGVAGEALAEEVEDFAAFFG
jgi:hypothetical protein